MISKSVFCLSLTTTELKELISFKKWTGKMWDKPPTKTIENLKSKIRAQLSSVQTKCAYCGLELGGTSNGEIEHIAPKANYRYPQFTFTLRNLVMACSYCNGFDKKGTKKTISKVHNIYAKCEFTIVHPYFDDPNDHFLWDNKFIEVLIRVKNNSTKGLNSIETFELDSPKMSEFRAQQVHFNEIKIKYNLNRSDKSLIDLIIQK